MPTALGSQGESRADMLLALKVLGDMLEHRRVPLSVRGARALGFLITLATGTLAGDLPSSPQRNQDLVPRSGGSLASSE